MEGGKNSQTSGHIFSTITTEPEGGSVVDWAIASVPMMRTINDFGIGDERPFSDHVEMQIKISIS